MKKIIVFITFVFMVQVAASAQMLSYSDAGMAFNKIMLGSGNSYRQVGNFKAIGSPYLFAEMIHGSVYSKTGQDNNVYFRIDNYAKTLELQTAKADKFLMQPIAQVDSFMLMASDSTLFKSDLYFVNSSLIDPSMAPVFLQKVVSGSKYNLYKLYTTSLVIATDNYAQSDLREFDLSLDYYYTSSATAGLKKLKLTKAALLREFKDNPVITASIEKGSLSKNPEPILALIFTQLNSN